MDPQTSILAFLAGVGIASASGLRAFLPLAALGLASRLGWVEIDPSMQWMSSNLALLALGIATALEIAADKIPAVDHVLDAVATFMRPAAAWLGSYALFVHWPTPWGQIVATLLGGAALAIHLAKAKLRLGSTVVSAGTANPVLSTIEDVAAFMLLAAAILVPIAVLLVLFLWIAAISRRARRRADPGPAPPAA